jgi:1-acyl-sn-glycerol-3-phosphate acyltransferase
MEKKKTWMLPRHKIITELARVVLHPYIVWKYGIRIEKFRDQGKRSYLVLYNHQTGFDQFFVGMAFRGPVYYMATEDIFSLGWISKLLRWAVAPIPIRKQTTDITAVMNCLKVAREGGTIAIAPEGNRTYSGRTEYMNPAIAALAKKMKLPIALYRIEGGYGVQPRWSDVVRRGRMRAYVSRVIEPEEYTGLTPEELGAMISRELYVDENCDCGVYKSRKRAEYLERCFYVCPDCGLTEYESHGCEATCRKCGKTVSYGEDKRIRGNGFEFPFAYAGEWYDYQNRYVNSLDVTKFTSEPLFRDTAKFSEVIVYKEKVLLRENCPISLYGDRMVLDEGKENELCLPFSEITAAACLGKNKLNIYHGKMIYQFKGSRRFNALKYVNLYFRYKNIMRGEPDDQFLGL